MSGARTQRFENIILVDNFLANFEPVKVDVVNTNLQNSLIDQIYLQRYLRHCVEKQSTGTKYGKGHYKYSSITISPRFHSF
jgi:hypothetical protein